MNKLYQYTILSKDIINIVSKYLLPSRIKYDKDFYHEFFLRTHEIKDICNIEYPYLNIGRYTVKYRFNKCGWFFINEIKIN